MTIDHRDQTNTVPVPRLHATLRRAARRPGRLLVLVVAVACLLPASTNARLADGPTRGMWVVRSTMTSPARIRAMVDDAVDAGIDTLLVQVRGRGDAYYLSDIEPRPAGLAEHPDFDPLAYVLDIAHGAGLTVHAWINVNLVASAATAPQAGHVVLDHPEWLMVPRALGGRLARVPPRDPAYRSAVAAWTQQNATQVEGLFISPLIPAAQEYTVRVLTDLVQRYPVDGLHLDYIRFPGPEFDYGPLALAEFRDWELPALDEGTAARLDDAAREQPTAWPDALPDAWTAFRLDRLTDMVARVARNAQAARPELIVSAAVLPNPTEARERKLQDWVGWARDGYLDAICPMIYTTSATTFVTQLAGVRAAAGETPVWAGIGAYRLPATRTADNIRAARRGGARGVLLYSYDSLVGPDAPSRSYLPALRSVLREPWPTGGTD